MTDGLEDLLLDGDGAVSHLSETRHRFRAASDYMDRLVTLCADPRPRVCDGATWILKAELEDGAMLSRDLTGRLTASLGEITSWQGALHLCQVIGQLDLDADDATRVITWARGYEAHPRPFLRAWAFHVRIFLAGRFPAFGAEMERAFQKAEADPAASVRARARQLRAKMP